MTYSFQALGTTWWIEIFDEKTETGLNAALHEVELFAAQFENRYSRFKADSLIAHLNTKRELIDPDEHCRAILTYGKNLYLRTNTTFNFLCGHILEARGYDADYSFVAKDSTSLAIPNPISDLIISSESISLAAGSVDLGGFGKGYLIDEIAKLLQEKYALNFFLINGGGDMYATSNHDQPIEVLLEHPNLPHTSIYKTTLQNQGFAASSPHKRVWQNSTGTHHHIVSDQITSDATYIKATRTAEADAFATTILQLDKNAIERLAQAEELAVAQFDMQSQLLTKTRNFD